MRKNIVILCRREDNQAKALAASLGITYLDHSGHYSVPELPDKCIVIGGHVCYAPSKHVIFEATKAIASHCFDSDWHPTSPYADPGTYDSGDEHIMVEAVPTVFFQTAGEAEEYLRYLRKETPHE